MTTTTEPTTTLALTNRQIHVLLAALYDRLDTLGHFAEKAPDNAKVQALAAEVSEIEDLLRQANARLPRDSERSHTHQRRRYFHILSDHLTSFAEDEGIDLTPDEGDYLTRLVADFLYAAAVRRNRERTQ